MEMEKPNYTVTLSVVDHENRDMETKITKDITTYSDLGWECSFLGELSSFINNFLKLDGWPQFDKDYVFLESCAIEELDYLDSCLADYRANQKSDRSDNIDE